MERERKDKAQLKRAHKKFGYVIHQNGVHAWLGFHEDVDLAPVYAGALLLGLLKPNCIVHMALEHQLFWFCVVQNGLPLVGVDLILDKRHIQHHVQQYSTLFPLYEVLGLDGTQGPGLTALIDAWRLQMPSLSLEAKHLSALLVISPAQRRRVRRRIWALVLSVLALCFLLLELLDVQLHLQAEAKQKIESSLKSTRLAELALQSQAVQRKEAQGYAKRFSEEREKYLSLNDPVAFWHAFNGLRHAIPLSINGLHPLVLQCEAHACVVNWALRGDLTGALKSARTGEFSDESSALKSPFTGLPFALDQALNARGEGVSTLALTLVQLPYFFPAIESPELLELSMTLDLKKHWPALVLSPMKTLVFDPKVGVKAMPRPAPLPSASLALGLDLSQAMKSDAMQSDASGAPSLPFQKPQLLVHQGEWQLSFLGDAALIDAEHFIGQLRGRPMALQSIVYTYRGALEMKGMYYFLPPLVATDPSRVEFEGLAKPVNLAIER